MPVDTRLPIAPWELSSRDRYSTHRGSYGQESPATDPERWSPPPEDRGLSALRGLSRAVTDLALPLTLPLDAAHAFAKSAGARFAGDPYFPAQAAVERWWSKNAERQAPPAAPEMTAPRDDLLTPEMAVRFANPAAWFQALNPLRAAQELAAVPGTALRGLGRLAAEGVERGVQGAGPLAALRYTVAPMNVVRDPGGQFSPVELDRALKELSPREPFEGWPGEYKKVDPPLRMLSGRGLNWLNQRTGQYLNDAEYRQLVENTQRTEPLHRWINTQLRRYVARDLGSPADPLLARARRGEPLHMNLNINEDVGPGSRLFPYTPQEWNKLHQRREGYLSGQPDVWNDPWGHLADAALYPTTVEAERATPGGMRGSVPDYEFLRRLPPDTPMWALRPNALNNLGFGHVRDVLGEQLATGELRPESLGRMSVEQVVRRTAEYDAALAKRMGEAAARREAEMPVLKAYPQAEGQEKPWRWVELNKPGAFAEESDRMGHSVRGYEPPKGYGRPGTYQEGVPPGMPHHPDWIPESGNSGRANYGFGGWDAIKEGRARVLSLRGPDGKSYATVEIAKTGNEEVLGNNLDGLAAAFDSLHGDGEFSKLTWGKSRLLTQKENEDLRRNTDDWWDITFWLGVHRPDLVKPEWYVDRITQIKGPQNQAPADEALPYVQDLVRNMGPWSSEIGDIRNTGLIKTDYGWMTKEEAKAKGMKYGGGGPGYEYWEPEGRAAGGAVRRPGLDDIMVELFDPPLERLVEEAFA